MKKIVAPEGFRDLIKDGCRKKSRLVDYIETKLNGLGFDEINTPTFEHFETFERGLGSRDLSGFFKMVSPEGKLIVLKSDMTIPIARVVSTKFRKDKGVLRFRYGENVYKIEEKYTGNLSELTDCGAELIGEGGFDEDLEILLAALEACDFLRNYGFILELGDVRIFKGVCDYLDLSGEVRQRLAYLIDNMILPDLEAYVEEIDLEDSAKEFFLNLPWANGGIEEIESMYRYAFTPDIKEALDYLSVLYKTLEDLGFKDYIRVDFSKIPSLDYYTSLIFEGFVEDVGMPVLSGGRYDDLIGLFQSEARSAVGFSIKVDYLLDLDIFSDKEETYLIEYPEGSFIQALEEAKAYKDKARVRFRKSDVDKISVRRQEC